MVLRWSNRCHIVYPTTFSAKTTASKMILESSGAFTLPLDANTSKIWCYEPDKGWSIITRPWSHDTFVSFRSERSKVYKSINFPLPHWTRKFSASFISSIISTPWCSVSHISCLLRNVWEDTFVKTKARVVLLHKCSEAYRTGQHKNFLRAHKLIKSQALHVHNDTLSTSTLGCSACHLGTCTLQLQNTAISSFSISLVMVELPIPYLHVLMRWCEKKLAQQACA